MTVRLADSSVLFLRPHLVQEAARALSKSDGTTNVNVGIIALGVHSIVVALTHRPDRAGSRGPSAISDRSPSTLAFQPRDRARASVPDPCDALSASALRPRGAGRARRPSLIAPVCAWLARAPHSAPASRTARRRRPPTYCRRRASDGARRASTAFAVATIGMPRVSSSWVNACAEDARGPAAHRRRFPTRRCKSTRRRGYARRPCRVNGGMQNPGRRDPKKCCNSACERYFGRLTLRFARRSFLGSQKPSASSHPASSRRA
jgi:hypothetical protein